MLRRVLALLSLVAIATGCGTVQPRRPQRNEAGCYVSVDISGGRCLWEQVAIVGEVSGVDWEGNVVEEWWAWFPQRPREEYFDTEGKLRAVNLPKSRVLLTGEHRLVRGVLCTCP